MTDRERFIARAIECGATINVDTATMLRITSANGKMTTTYLFDNNGKFKDFSHE